jgi:hypothetical protein
MSGLRNGMVNMLVQKSRNSEIRRSHTCLFSSFLRAETAWARIGAFMSVFPVVEM